MVAYISSILCFQALPCEAESVILGRWSLGVKEELDPISSAWLCGVLGACTHQNLAKQLFF